MKLLTTVFALPVHNTLLLLIFVQLAYFRFRKI